MIGLDTNVLVRLLTGDEPSQQAAARKYLAKHSSAQTPCFVNRVVLVELVWVLDALYRYKAEQIATAVERLLRTRNLTVESATEVWSALASYRTGADFADALIGATNATSGCSQTVTFDRDAAKRLDHFRPLASK